MAKNRPNIVLLITETWRGDCLGRLGHPAVETPHLDGLSAGGVTFTEAHTPCPSCIAARRSLMTGQAPNTHGMVGYQDGQPWEYEHTLAGELTKAGYRTINVGKTHFHPIRLKLGYEQLVVPQDYDEWLEKETGLVSGRLAHGVHANSWMARPNHLPEAQQQETWFTNEAMKRVRDLDGKRPFFLTLSFNGVHAPWCPPQVYYDQFKDKEIPDPVVGDWAKTHADGAQYPMDVNAWRGRLSLRLIRRARVAYYAYMAYIDAQIGRLIGYLGRYGNTAFLFTSDHGEMLGDHNLWRKTYAYDPSARVPFILRLTHGCEEARNVETDALVGLEDIMPTLLEIAGAGIPDTVEGKSVLSYARDGGATGREYYHHEHSPCYAPDNAYQSLTSKEWKYIWNPITGAEQLFHRAKDPKELHDLARKKKYADVLAGWHSKLAAHLKGRPENLSDGENLSPGKIPVWRIK